MSHEHKRARTDSDTASNSSGSSDDVWRPDGWDFTVHKEHDFNIKFSKARKDKDYNKLYQERHEWLKWPNSTKNEKVRLNNRLVKHQNKELAAPKRLDWDALERLGMRKRIKKMIETRVIPPDGGEDFGWSMWVSLFNIEEDVYREWCLEFLSSIYVESFKDEEINTAQIIHFRAGGVWRHCTITDFGYLIGCWDFQYLNDTYLDTFSEGGKTAADHDLDSMNLFWQRISGQNKLSGNSSKAYDISDPVHRLLQKLVAYNFRHRSMNWDKVYNLDAQLMRFWIEGAPHDYCIAPLLLARYLQYHKDDKIVGGHFISQIYVTLGLGSTKRECSYFKKTDVMDEKELIRLQILDKQGHPWNKRNPPAVEIDTQRQAGASTSEAGQSSRGPTTRLRQEVDALTAEIQRL